MLKMALVIGLIQQKKRIGKDRPRYALNQVTNNKYQETPSILDMSTTVRTIWNSTM